MSTVIQITIGQKISAKYVGNNVWLTYITVESDDLVNRVMGMKLQKLSLRNCWVTGTERLFGFVDTCVLHVRYNRIRNQGAMILCKLPSLTKLDISFNLINDDCMQSFASSSVEVLCLAGNNIGDRGAEILASSKTLVALDLSCTRITDRSLRALSENKHLNCLELASNDIGSDQLSYLANSGLKSLNIAYNDICSRGAIILSSSSSITELDVSGNEITSSGIVALARNSVLKNMTLSNNQIGIDGFSTLVNNITLTSLNIYCDEDITPLIKNNTLVALYGSYFDEKAFNRNKNITHMRGRSEVDRSTSKKLSADWTAIAMVTSFIRANRNSPLSRYIIYNIELIKDFATTRVFHTACTSFIHN